MFDLLLEDGSGSLQLEDGSGNVLLEETAADTPVLQRFLYF
jgi:hypothetical protein